MSNKTFFCQILQIRICLRRGTDFPQGPKSFFRKTIDWVSSIEKGNRRRALNNWNSDFVLCNGSLTERMCQKVPIVLTFKHFVLNYRLDFLPSDLSWALFICEDEFTIQVTNFVFSWNLVKPNNPKNCHWNWLFPDFLNLFPPYLLA